MTEPRAYDLTKQYHIDRLMREVYGYLKTCLREHHGTDFEGRQFALEALEDIVNERIVLMPKKGTQQ